MKHPSLVDPKYVTNFDRSTRELLVFWLFALFVRGKTAITQAGKLYDFIEYELDGDVFNLAPLSRWSIDRLLREVKAGQYNTLTKAIDETLLWISRDPFFLRHCTVAELEGITGVGPKTARFFIMHSQRGANIAALDVHVLRYLRLRLGTPVPLVTPTGKKYLELEQIFLDMTREAGVEPAVMDLAIWRASRDGNPLGWRDYL